MKTKILFTEEEIDLINQELADKINAHYDGERLIVISLLRGSFIFCADLVRKLKGDIVIDFLTTSSYDHEKISSGFVQIVTDIRENLDGQNVLVVDDILDSGKTMTRIIEFLSERNPKTIKSCVLLDKPSRRTEDYEADFVGREIEDLFIVGYGLNYEDYYRNTPYIFYFED